MRDADINIRELAEGDLDAVVAFSIRAWEPVFTSVREMLGDDVFFRLHPDWRESQAEAVRSVCTNDERDVYVAVINDRPVGFVAIALDAFHERMGAIEIIGVDPEYQQRGIGAQLTEFAVDHMKRRGMDIAVVRNRRRPRSRTGSRALRGDRLHVVADRSLLPATPVGGRDRSIKGHSRTPARPTAMRHGRRG
jgi:ribosomal protein S18 acetylase RimI-like enzyme